MWTVFSFYGHPPPKVIQVYLMYSPGMDGVCHSIWVLFDHCSAGQETVLLWNGLTDIDVFLNSLCAYRGFAAAAATISSYCNEKRAIYPWRVLKSFTLRYHGNRVLVWWG